jgi:hypothetical protein
MFETPAVIEITADLHKAIDAACAALRRHPNIYQRGGRLTQTLRIAERVAWARQGEEGVPTLREVPTATLTAELTRVALFEKYDARSRCKKPVIPPEVLVNAVAQKGDWPGVRTLHGVVEAPLMRADGSILQTPGYDAATGVIYEPCGVEFPIVTDAPTEKDAVAALTALAEPFEEFPFATAADALVPVAVVLTSLAMGALEGCNVPCFVFDANTQGTGKTLCADAVSWILTGREVPKQTFPGSDGAELEKILGGAALAATPMLMLDNVNSVLGGDALEQRSTCRGTSHFRLLGQTKNQTLPWRTIMLASGNNVQTTVDMRRRVICCTLFAKEENPEERPIKRTDLRGWILANRPRLVTAALTLLRAYVVAGRPKQPIGAMGNFEEWTALVAGALRWASGVDVLTARMPSAATVDPVTEAYAGFLASFSDEPSARWVLKREYSAGELALMPCWDNLVAAHDPNRSLRIAGLLRKMKNRVIGNRFIAQSKDTHNKQRLYRVVLCG